MSLLVDIGVSHVESDVSLDVTVGSLVGFVLTAGCVIEFVFGVGSVVWSGSGSLCPTWTEWIGMEVCVRIDLDVVWSVV